MSKNPANRGLGGHIKEGLKNIPTTYKALYNNGTGVKGTVGGNLKVITSGKMNDNTEGNNKVPMGKRVGIVGMGAASVTPLGPIAAFGAGVKKSVDQKKKAIEQNRPENVEKRALESGKVIKKTVPSMPSPPKTVAPKPQPKVNEFKKPLTPSRTVQPVTKNPMGNNRTPPTNTKKK